MAQVRGKGEVKAKLAKLAEAYPRALAASMQAEATEILGGVPVPRRSGELQDSAFVSAAEGTGRGTAVRFGFRAGYARYVKGHFARFRKILRGRRRGVLGRLAKRVRANLTAAPIAGDQAVTTKTFVPKIDRRRRGNRRKDRA